MKIRSPQFNLTQTEEKLFRSLKHPAQIQDFINSLACNREKNGQTLMSPRRVMATQSAHCFEGALFAAAILWYHGNKPLLLDLKSDRTDLDHVVALFQKNGYWGAISKTNHAVLRYREPVYKTIRELALSYFHEYVTDSGAKTLRSYSVPFDLRSFGKKWITEQKDLWDIGGALDDSRHTPIASPAMIRTFRKADQIEIAAGKLLEQNL